MFDVVALGELLIDFTHLSTNSAGYPVMSAHPGGAPCNLLATLAKFGAATAFLGKVGNDNFGQLLRGTLTEAGIDTCGLISDNDVFTTLAFVSLDNDGERSFSFARNPGADTMLRVDELDLSLIEQSKIFHFGSVSLTHEPARSATYSAVEYAKSIGRLISFDPNLRLPLWEDPKMAKKQILWGLMHADVVKISDDEIAFLFGLTPEAGAKHILEHYNPQLVFVTCGASGCYFDNGTASCHVSAPKGLDTIDTTGAGDIFGGTALWKLLQLNKPLVDFDKADLLELTRFACTAATLSTTKLGGISSIPDFDDIRHFLTNYPS